jgi:hypothetical protein
MAAPIGTIGVATTTQQPYVLVVVLDAFRNYEQNIEGSLKV